MPLKTNAPSETQIEAFLGSGRFGDAKAAADQLKARSPRSVVAWVGSARANMGLGHLDDADRDLIRALALAPADPVANLFRGVLDQRLGRLDASVNRLRALAGSPGPWAVEAWFGMADALHVSNRLQELEMAVAGKGAWSSDPRAELFRARVDPDRERATERMVQLTRQTSSVVVRRVAGFDAVKMLDKAGRYREAFDMATFVHGATGHPFDLSGMLGQVKAWRDLLGRGGAWFSPRAEPVQGMAMVVALPRSGTTLLEQMLDSHPEITGIGEYDGVNLLGQELQARGTWPSGLGLLPKPLAAQLQATHLQNARNRVRRPARWLFDKNLRAWRWLPAVAAVLPGTLCIHMARDPRDMAISIFLSFFNPNTDGWTSSLDSIRQVIESEQSVVPQALERLGLPHESIVYEDMVADPERHARRCLDRMDLPMDPAVLRPHENTRTAITLSHEQVRQPIHAGSIGRWKNYAFAFDGSWDGVVAAHQARRARR
ncbi:MAG: hypothetical protein RLZZ558_131 [Planctomycetota bacterium]